MDIRDFDSVEELLGDIERKDKLRAENPQFYGIAENFADLDAANNYHRHGQATHSIRISWNNAIFNIFCN